VPECVATSDDHERLGKALKGRLIPRVGGYPVKNLSPLRRHRLVLLIRQHCKAVITARIRSTDAARTQAASVSKRLDAPM
jgi:hypothetical protein